MQRTEVKGFSTGSQHGQVVLEDPDGMVQLSIRMRPMMAHWLAHELKECQCPAVSMYRLLQELLTKFGGNFRVSLIDASADNTPGAVDHLLPEWRGNPASLPSGGRDRYGRTHARSPLCHLESPENGLLEEYPTLA